MIDKLQKSLRFLLALFRFKRPIKLTKSGWVFILYTIGVGAGAINTGNNLLYLMFGLFLGLMLASGVLSDISLWGVGVEWEFPHHGQANSPCLIPLRITNYKRWLPSISISIELEGTLRGEKVTMRTFIPSLAAGQTATAHFVFLPIRRGWFEVEDLRISTRYPFGLLRKWWTRYRRGANSKPLSGLNTGLFIYPPVHPLEARSLSWGAVGDQDQMTQDSRGDGATVFGIREYRDSDNPRRIHWKASAKKAPADGGARPSWLTREMESNQKQNILLSWPELAALPQAEEEPFVEYTFSLATFLEKEGHDVKLLIEWRASSPVTPYFLVQNDSQTARLGEFLSLVDPRHAAAENVNRYLVPVAEREFPGGKPAVIDVFENYSAWKRLGTARSAEAVLKLGR